MDRGFCGSGFSRESIWPQILKTEIECKFPLTETNVKKVDPDARTIPYSMIKGAHTRIAVAIQYGSNHDGSLG
ncbi:hypothetical protein C7S18_17035 [Ahniella affigens]|uniref:Uncharacterized protein n=1 Tax=Ahniella affigens TaxID=2021234 RepID=A0A2P1PVA4_9GAMM|nr:hypothetical protein C7S18_17035 [Ahniella affigens]